MDEQLYRLQFERADLLKRIDEDQDDLNGLMQKHKDLIAQVRTLSQLLKVGRLDSAEVGRGCWFHEALGKDGVSSGAQLHQENINPPIQPPPFPHPHPPCNLLINPSIRLS